MFDLMPSKPKEGPCVVFGARVLFHTCWDMESKCVRGKEGPLVRLHGTLFSQLFTESAFTEPLGWEGVDRGEPPEEDPQAGVGAGEAAGEEGRKGRP